MITIAEKSGAAPKLTGKLLHKMHSIIESGEILLKREFWFVRGFLAPAPDLQWRKEFKAKLDVYSTPELKDMIRKKMGYDDLSDLLSASGLHQDLADAPPRQLFVELTRALSAVREKITAVDEMKGAEEDARLLRQVENCLKVEIAMVLVEISYGFAKRKSGNPAASHALRAGLFAATMGSPTEYVLTALLHDIVEDTRDMRSHGIFYRVPHFNGKKYAHDILEQEGQIYGHIKGLFGDAVAENVKLLTRAPGERKGEGWEKNYQLYLERLNEHVGAAFAKAIDGIINIWELDPITDKEEKDKTISAQVKKAAWQIQTWRKLSWLITELLREGVEKYSDDRKLLVEMRKISEREVADFERGIVVVGKREFTRSLLDSVPDHGLPVMVLYKQGSWKLGKHFELELPFLSSDKLSDVETAKKIAQSLGASVHWIHEARTLLLPRMRQAVFLRFKGNWSEIKQHLPDAVKMYEAAVSPSLTEMGMVDRKEHARMARESVYYENNITETPKTPPQGNGGGQSPPGRQETGTALGEVIQSVKSGFSLFFGGGQPLAEGLA